jgi:predicted RNA-binding protein YlxR (DUF448 family)/ribosomal protein L30E
VSEAPFLTDEGPAPRRRGRRCVASRTSLPRERLVRFVVDPTGQMVPDLAATLPGRGVWLTAERGAIRTAVAKGLLAKAARGRVRVAADLADQVERMLVRRCQEVIGLARRAGIVVAGFDQVAEELRRHRAALLVAARDGAPDGRRKLRALAGDLPVIELLDRRELGEAIGRDDVVHLAMLPGGLARRLLMETGRLAGFRGRPGRGVEDADVGTEEPSGS